MASPRLFVQADFQSGHELALAPAEAHYLGHVLRLQPGHVIRVFNGRDGEWSARIVALGRKQARIEWLSPLRAQVNSRDLTLLFAPLKKDRTDFVIEKATELGVSRIQPVITERTQGQNFRVERLQAFAREAAEQTERLDLVQIATPAKLQALMRDWPIDHFILFADEQGDGLADRNDLAEPWGGRAGRAPPARDVLQAICKDPATRPGRLALLIGPEGGFSPGERQYLRALTFIRPVCLGPRILRAETASVALLTLVQAHWGDWQSSGMDSPSP